MRKQVRLPDKLVSERRFRASQLYLAGMESARQGRAVEAAANIRLAIAFDPWSDLYKEGFAEVQAEVHRLRAEQLLSEAGSSWDASPRSEALRLLEEALHYRPSDARIHERAASVALALGDLENALEYATAAWELAPENPDCGIALARVQLQQEQFESAGKTLERVRRVAPQHEGLRAATESLQAGRKKVGARR